MMAITAFSDITLLTLGISLASIILVIILITMQRQRKLQYHDEGKDIEVSAVVSEFTQRMKKLEESIVDQKVKLEILDLRVSRPHNESRGWPSAGAQITRTSTDNGGPATERAIPLLPPARQPQMGNTDRKEGNTELEALRIVYESQGRATVKEIQRRIGRTREHTSRMMNALFQNGLVQRDVTVRPFSYSITQKGIEELSG